MAAARHSAETRVEPEILEPDQVSPDPRWRDPAASRPGQMIWQFIGVGLLGGCAPFVFDGVAHGYELGGTVYTVATTGMLIAVAAGLIALLYLLVRATSLITPLGTSRRRRLLWAVLVATVGTLVWFLGRTVATARDPGVLHNGRMAVLIGGGLAILVAAALTRGWYLRAPVVVALVGLAWLGVFAFRDTGPTELEYRLDALAMNPADLWMVDIAGYHAVRHTFGQAVNGDEYQSATTGAGPITLKIFDIGYGCRPPRCTDSNYVLLPADHQISVIRDTDRTRVVALVGHQVIELTGPADVDPGPLKLAISSARRATDAELVAYLPQGPAPDPVEAVRIWLRKHT